MVTDTQTERADKFDAVATNAKTTLSSTFTDQRTGMAPKPDSQMPGSLELTNPYKPDAPQQSPALQADAPRGQWTMAVDLTTTQGYGSDHVHGAANQVQALQELARESSGSPVAFVVQAALPIDVHQNGDTMSIGGFELQRYMIRDGQITSLGTAPTRGIGADLTDLLQTANRVAPSEHVGLIMQSHGTASGGLLSDSGRISLADFNSAVQNGLQGSGHDRLNLIDFDACSTASVNTLQSLRGIADTIVGSAETERSFGDVDAQNLTAIGRDLIQNPQMSGSEFGRHIVALATGGANSDHSGGERNGESGTPDLASFDTANVPQLTSALNSFGAELSAVSDRDARRTIRELATAAPAYDAQGQQRPGLSSPDRDLSTFARSVTEAIAQGRLNDPDGSLRSAADGVVQAQAQVQTAYFGQPQGGYDSRGGLSAFLPSFDSDTTDDARRMTDIGLLQRVANSTKESFANREALPEVVNSTVSSIRQASGAEDPLLSQLEQSAKDASQADNPAAYEQARNQMRETIAQLAQSREGQRELQAAQERIRQRRQEVIASYSVGDAPAWTNFINTLAN